MKPTSLIGILALQGDYDKHRQMLERLGRRTLLVFTRADLAQCDGLIIPGGESTTLINLMKKHNLWEAVREFGRLKPLYGTCAGCIVTANSGEAEQDSLNLIDVAVQRNAYGRQVDSFIDDLTLQLNGKQEKMEGVFIRAPKIQTVGAGVTPLAWHGGDVVLAKQGHVLVGTFHPELTDDLRIHQYFVEQVDQQLKTEE